MSECNNIECQLTVTNKNPLKRGKCLVCRAEYHDEQERKHRQKAKELWDEFERRMKGHQTD